MGRLSGATSSLMLRGTPGWRRMRPARSRLRTIVDRGWADEEVALHVGLGGRASEHARIGVDESQILALLIGEALAAGAASGA